MTQATKQPATRRIDLGKASAQTRGAIPSCVQQESFRIIENGLRYRSKPAGLPDSKIPDVP